MSEPHDFASGSIEFGPIRGGDLNKETQHGPPRSWTSAASLRRAGTEVIPSEVMKVAHREKLRLCDSLESIADALPNVDRLKCLGTAKNIVPLLRDIHGFEETVIFPAYEAHLTPAEAKLASTSRLRVEHLEDQCFAGEVAETLLAIGHCDSDRERGSCRVHATRPLRRLAATHRFRTRACPAADRNKRRRPDP